MAETAKQFIKIEKLCKSFMIKDGMVPILKGLDVTIDHAELSIIYVVTLAHTVIVHQA